MRKITYLLNIEENEVEGANFGSYYRVPILLNHLIIIDESGHEKKLNGKLVEIGIYGDLGVFKSSKSDRIELRNPNIKKIISQMVWHMSSSTNATTITLSLKKFDTFFLLSSREPLSRYNIMNFELPMKIADFKFDKGLTFTSDDEQFTVIVNKGFSFGITYHDRFSSKSIVPESVEDIVSGMPTFEVEYSKKNGKETLCTYLDLKTDGFPDVRKRDLTKDVSDFISDYCEKGANLKMVFEAIKDYAYGLGDTIRCIDLCTNYWYCK